MEHARPYKFEVEEEVARLRENPDDYLEEEVWDISFPSTFSHVELGTMTWQSLWHFRVCTLTREGVQVGAYYFPFKTFKDAYIRLDGPFAWSGAGRDEMLVLCGAYEKREKDKTHYARIHQVRSDAAVSIYSPYYLKGTEYMALRIKAYHRLYELNARN